jgi:hypothetical protein
MVSLMWEAAPYAPFHGFTIFLNGAGTLERSSCIILEVRLGVVPPDDSEHEPLSRPLTRVKVGNRTKTIGLRAGIRYENLGVYVELPREGYTNDLSVRLLTPATERRKNESIFRSFLASLTFP